MHKSNTCMYIVVNSKGDRRFSKSSQSNSIFLWCLTYVKNVSLRVFLKLLVLIISCILSSKALSSVLVLQKIIIITAMKANLIDK